ncbi:MAG: hypothetical protein AABW91_03720 [Nanoarchaeota archaeon]
MKRLFNGLSLGLVLLGSAGFFTGNAENSKNPRVREEDYRDYPIQNNIFYSYSPQELKERREIREEELRVQQNRRKHRLNLEEKRGEKISGRIYEKRVSNLLPPEIYQERFAEFKDSFAKYSKLRPRDLNAVEFKSLLVSIAQKESSLGYPNGGPKDYDLLMGYGDPNDKKNYGAEKQIKLSSNLLKMAFEGKSPPYKPCLDKKTKEDVIKGILSVYNRGKVNEDGLKYANEVYSYFLKWNRFFRTHDNVEGG